MISLCAIDAVGTWAEITSAEQSLNFTHNYLRRARDPFEPNNRLKYPHTPQLLARSRLTGSEAVWHKVQPPQAVQSGSNWYRPTEKG